MGVRLAALALMLVAAGPPEAHASPADPQSRFRAAGDSLRAGDTLKAIAEYRALARDGIETAALYWNWAQAAGARGEVGEALWALLRAREIEPGDRALGREIDRLRDTARLDPAEMAPEPLAELARTGRRLHLGLLSLVLGAVSVAVHATRRLEWSAGSWTGPAAAWLAGLALLAGAVPLLGTLARSRAVVVPEGALLLDAASPTASALGNLRRGEVVPVLEVSGGYLRIEDSSGARGWARHGDVWPLEGPPPPPSGDMGQPGGSG